MNVTVTTQKEISWIKNRLARQEENQQQTPRTRKLVGSQNLGELGALLVDPVVGVLLDLGLSKLGFAVGSGVGVEPEEDLPVAERVLLLDTHLATTLLELATLGWADDGLDFGGVDKTADVSVGDDVGWEEVVLLEERWGGGGSVDVVESLECGVGPDDESSEMSTGGKLEEVKSLDGGSLNTGDVSESLDEGCGLGSLGVEDDKRSTALPVAAVS